jgi:hypothetical protein
MFRALMFVSLRHPWVLLATGTLLAQSPAAALPQTPVDVPPPVPFEDVGACPFEGCVYREWTARRALPVRAERRVDAPVIFRLTPGEKITALTGVVITVKAARVQFRKPTTIESMSGTIHIAPGQTLYLLTNQGEGFTKAWFNGRFYHDVDTVSFLNGVCEVVPSRCTGRVIERSPTEWWVQIRNKFGKTGWTHEPEKFDGSDALADPRR